MNFKKYEKGFNISNKICDKYDKLSMIYRMGLYNSNEYNQCLNDIKVLVSNEKFIYDEMSLDEAKDYFTELSNLKFKDFSMVGFDNISVFKRYYLNIYFRCNLSNNNSNNSDNLFGDDMLNGMITVEALRKTYNSILGVNTENISEVKFKEKLFDIFSGCIPNVCSLYQYSENRGLKYNYDINRIPDCNIKSEFENKKYDRNILIEYAKTDIMELFNFNNVENTPENVFLMLYIGSKIDVYLELFNYEELKIINDYYNLVSVLYRDSFVDITIRNKFSKRKKQ